MCGRYSLTVGNPFDVRVRFPIGEQVQVRRRFNVAPGDEVLAVTTTREGAPRGELLRWGLIPPWSEDPSSGLRTINARLETVADKPAYRESYRRFRCLVLADGFYEWQRRADGGKQAYRITRGDGAPFAFAGLWARWRSAEREIRSCTIITRSAQGPVAEIHDRMPVILTPDLEEPWLSTATPTDALPDLLDGLAPDQLAVTPVGAAVNDARYDGPECLAAPAQPEAEAVQTALF